MKLVRHYETVVEATRSLARSPGFALPMVALLALGIGGATALWTVVHAVILAPLPFPAPDQLVAVSEAWRGSANSLSPSNFRDFAQGGTLMQSMAAYTGASAALSLDDAHAVRLNGVAVTGKFFEVLGAPSAAGRLLIEEDAKAPERRVVLSHELWGRQFGFDPAITGKRLRLDGAPAIVVGVAAPGRAYPEGTEFWSLLSFSEEDYRTQRGAHYLDAIGRLRPGATVSEANNELELIAQRLRAEYPKTNSETSALVQPLLSVITVSARPTLLLLSGAMAVMLLGLCANLAGMTMARWMARGRDLSVRGALGATRGQLASAIVAESVLLGVAGAGVGAAAAGFAVDAWASTSTRFPRLSEATFGLAAGSAAALIAALCGLSIGIVPALSVIGRDPAMAMAAGRSSPGLRGRRGRRILVVATCALAVILLAGASVLTRSYSRLARVATGFLTVDRLSFALNIPETSYATPERRAAFLDEILSGLRALPGVSGAVATFGLPYGEFGYSISLTRVDGVPQADATAFTPAVRVVTPGFFRIMGIPIRKGREFSDSDRFGSAPVVVVNETAARRIYPGVDPLGRTIEIGTRLGQGRGRVGGEVVGMVGDVREQRLHREPPAIVYVVHDQFPVDLLTVVVAAPSAASTVLGQAVRETVRGVDPDVPLFRLQSLEELRLASIGSRLAVVRVMNAFALAGLAMSVLGLFSLLARMVHERRRELAIRLVIGARPGDLVRRVAAESFRLALSGGLVGLLLCLPLLGLARSLVFEISAWDPMSLSLSVAALVAGGTVAALLPARHAAQLEPASVLKEH